MSNDQSSTFFLPLHFNGQQVRMSIDDAGIPWWVAQDVGTLLDIQNVRQNIATFPQDERSLCTIYTPGGPQQMLTVNEPGLYHLIFQSRKKSAEAFKRWVFRDVLPALRRTGTYTIPESSVLEPDRLTPKGQLPAPTPRVKEHAEVSWHLAAVWALLRDSAEALTNHELAKRTGVAPRTARAHTRYLLQLGLIDLHETFPRHLYQVSLVAEKRNAAVLQRLNTITALIQARSHF